MSILAFQMPEKVVMEKATDFHGLFEFKPLEKGYGVTIAIEGVHEDVSEIILNLKKIRFKKTQEILDNKVSMKIKGQTAITA
eukprot:gene54084-72280_t